MPVDTSIYQNRTPPDPIAGLGGTVGLANALTNNQILNAQNKLTQGNLQGQGQYGNALAGAMNPDGTIDPNKANQAYVEAGGNKFYAPQAFQSSANLYGTNIGNTNLRAAGADAQSAAEIAKLNAIANDGQSNPYQRMLAQGHDDLWNGTIGGPAFHSIFDTMPPGDKASTQYMKTRTAGTIPGPSQAAPAPTTYNPVTLAPVEKPYAAKVAAAGQPGGLEPEPPPGVIATSAADKAILQKAQLASAAIMTQNRNLEAALPIVEKLKNSDFGVGSAEWSTLRSAATSLGIFGDQDTTLTGRQLANKMFNAVVQGNPHASDAGLSLDRAAKPNMDVTKSADVHIMKQLMGWGAMDAAMPKMYQQDPDKVGQPFSDYQSGYYNKYDPDAFHMKTATPDERAEILASKGYTQGKNGPMPPKPGTPAFGAYQKFIHTLSVAQKAGVLPAPGANQ